VTISFGGDVHFDGSSRPALTGGMRYIAPLLKPADIAMVNLETAITTRGTPEPKTYHFRAPASAFSALRNAGVDVVTMANNHGVDYGPVGLQDSLAAIKASGFPTVGIGANADKAYAPWRTTVRGQRLAFIGATQVIDDNLRDTWPAGANHAGLASAFNTTRLLQAVRDARRTSDVVVVYLHWGTERVSCPNGKQRGLAPQLVAAGADVVVGSHAHVLLGAGYLGRSYVDYGLGNFVFYKRGDGLVAQTGVLTLTVRRHSVDKASFAPAHISSGLPYPVTGDAAARAVEYWKGLRGCTGLKSAAAG
jgi:poly-gamma-glutamate synthesis protein (capsule biosynthesis protein)